MDKKLILILILAFFLRLYGISWDSGFHFHPDERLITMVANQLHFFDKLDPNFFNYGSLPFYLLKGSAQLIDLFFSAHTATYQGLLYIGRTLSILFDVGTTFIIYKLVMIFSKKKKVAFFSSFIYAVMFFPIQNSHFFTVDILFTFLTTLLLYELVLYSRNRSLMYLFTISISFAALFATKFTAVIFLPIILLTVAIKNEFSYFSILHSLFFILITLSFSFLFMPYAFLDYPSFVRDISLQLTMSKNPYVFPYTLQYVNTTPYLYFLKNIIMWGMGPFISLLCLIGLRYKLKFKNVISNDYLMFVIFYSFYFLVIGASAVKFMRYMLPLYPFFAVLAGFGLSRIHNRTVMLTYITVTIIWSLFFITIYSYDNTRIAATEWILNTVKPGSRLAVEYWDDYLPVYKIEDYYLNELHLYDLPDNDSKWKHLNDQLQKSDYLIIASNRLSVPLQRLADCNTYRLCYPKTAEYYQKLFAGGLNFKKAAEFSVKPGFQIGSFKFQINDESADESFTVFDHPKITIFKKL